jgi:hypothetical protein
MSFSGGGTTDGGVSRRRLLFLGAAGTLGVVFARMLDPVFRNKDVSAPATPDPHAHGDPTAEGTPAANDASTVETQVAGLVTRRWSDPQTWQGKLPGPGDVAKIDSAVLLDMNPSVGGLVIGPAGSLTFDPGNDRTLTSKGNVIVRGRLVMRPKNSGVLHKIRITGSNESAFKGGGAVPVNSDTGLWVVGHGVLDIAGTAKRGWARAAGSVAKGAKSIALASTPSGWRVGDEVAIAPTSAPSNRHHAEYDYATIKSISGKKITLSKPTRYVHPRVSVGLGKAYSAEVLNLTRNVQVEGKSGGRVHIFINSGKKQSLRFFAARYVGARKGSKGVLGRYGVHFHMVGNASRGSLVEGAVVRDAGHHAFVAHASHGVTFRDCVSHNTMDEAYWWDPGAGNATRDVLYDRCVASLVHTNDNEFRLAGFWLGHGEGNRAIGCVATGIDGQKNAAGFSWPENPGPRTDGTVWGFKDCVAHNNKVNGIFVWQNNNGKSVISDFVAYHNGRSGIEHGAYKNNYVFKDSILYGNGQAGAFVHAVSGGEIPLVFSKVLFDAAGRSSYAIIFERHTAPPGQPTEVTGCTFKGYTKAAFGFVAESAKIPDTVDVVGCTYAANEFWLESAIDPASVIRVQDPKHGALALRRKDQPGVYTPDWNASVTPIAKFA